MWDYMQKWSRSYALLSSCAVEVADGSSRCNISDLGTSLSSRTEFPFLPLGIMFAVWQHAHLSPPSATLVSSSCLVNTLRSLLLSACPPRPVLNSFMLRSAWSMLDMPLREQCFFLIPYFKKSNQGFNIVISVRVCLPCQFWEIWGGGIGDRAGVSYFDSFPFFIFFIFLIFLNIFFNIL